ncbi:MAG: insulinase family protein, partial [Bacteroidales bacterium]|nr:insulinase family protein [Bacteroidales bacterium]
EVAHCGLIINAGSRDEEAHEQGIAHFVEHLIFKGTRKRKAYHILSRMDDVGGEINAYTSKEETCIHTSFLHKDYERSLELLSDITFNSVFPGKEMVREKDVIIDEINSYKDNPAESIYDDFEELVFEGQPLGRNILGTPDLLRKFNREDIESFVRRKYLPGEMVITSIGNISFPRLIQLCEKHFGQILPAADSRGRIPYNGYQPKNKTFQRDTNQAHCIIGNVAYDLYDPRRITMTLLENLIAGPGLNSRLNMLLREKLGYVYHVESSYTPFSDVGLFTLYFGAEKSRLDKTLEQVYRELERLRTIPLGKMQLRKAKRQLFGQLAISSESPSTRMIANGKSYLMLNRVDSLEEIREKIEAVTAEQMMETAREVLNPQQITTLTYL